MVAYDGVCEGRNRQSVGITKEAECAYQYCDVYRVTCQRSVVVTVGSAVIRACFAPLPNVRAALRRPSTKYLPIVTECLRAVTLAFVNVPSAKADDGRRPCASLKVVGASSAELTASKCVSSRLAFVTQAA